LLIKVYERVVYGKVKISEVLNMRFLKRAFVKKLGQALYQKQVFWNIIYTVILKYPETSKVTVSK
jgi:hypothetical protein